MFKFISRLIAVLLLVALGIFGYWFWQQKQHEYKINTTRQTIVSKMQAVKNLETAQLHVEKIIEGKKDLHDLLPGFDRDNLIQNFFFRDEIVFVAQGVISAGYDLSQFHTGHIIINDDLSVTLRLPPAIILSRKLTEESKPFERNLGLLTKGDTQLETEIRNKTLAEFEREAIEKGLLEDAQKNAEETFSQLFLSVGVKLKQVDYMTLD